MKNDTESIALAFEDDVVISTDDVVVSNNTVGRKSCFEDGKRRGVDADSHEHTGRVLVAVVHSP